MGYRKGLRDGRVQCVMIKQSPIPEALGLATEASMDGFRKIDEEIDIQNKISKAMQQTIGTL
jgi:hypothetical protein